jgi:hypothetical protein
MACWLFFNFALLFDFGYCSLAQEMSFVDHYLPYFRQQLITALLLAFLPFLPLFTESSHGDQLLASPPFSGVLSVFLPPLLCVSFQFIVYYSFFLGGCQSAQGAMLVYPRGGWVKTTQCWALTCLFCQMSPKQFWSLGLAAVAALLFSQCNVAWRSSVWARGSGC